MLKIRQFTFNPIQENTYIVYDEEGSCAIIDPGCYFDYERKELTDFISQEGLQPKCLLNTHCHFDHVFGNKLVADTYGLQPQLHPSEKVMLDYAAVSAEKWGFPFENYSGELIYITENALLQLGKHQFKVLLTPGHSPGSVCFYNAAQQFVIGGDVLFRQSIGRTDLPMGDHEALLKSIREKLFTLPDEVKVYPGHGPDTTIGYEKRNNPFLNG